MKRMFKLVAGLACILWVAQASAESRFWDLVSTLEDSPGIRINSRGVGLYTGSWEPQRPAYDPTRMTSYRPCVARDVHHQASERYQDTLLMQDCTPFGR